MMVLVGCGENDLGPLRGRLVLPENTGLDMFEPQRFEDLALAQGVPQEALDEAIDYYDQNSSMIPNKSYLTVVDFTPHSGKKRFFMMNLKTGEVEALYTSHGVGSDRDNDGYAREFSNTPGSNMSSLGFFLTAERYQGKNGLSMRLDGLEESNDLARPRAIVVHGASYVGPHLSRMGRSWGCPAVELRLISRVVKQLERGSLFYGYLQGM